MAETSGSTTVSTKLGRIAKLAREMPQAALTTLAQHIDIDWLREAHRRTRKDGATGVDRQTAYEYAKNLEENLRSQRGASDELGMDRLRDVDGQPQLGGAGQVLVEARERGDAAVEGLGSLGRGEHGVTPALDVGDRSEQHPAVRRGRGTRQS